MVKNGAIKKEKYPPEKQRCMPFQLYTFETVCAKKTMMQGHGALMG